MSGSTSTSSSSSGDVWIYHEKQEALLCGQHALNNLIQDCVFSPESLANIAHQLDELELTYMAENNEGGVKSKEYLQHMAELKAGNSGNVDPHGNFSIQVLRSALLHRYDLELPNLRQEGISTKEVTTWEGFICNKHSHWFAIRNIEGNYWNLNSTKDQPERISHFHLASDLATMMADGYSVFCVTNNDDTTKNNNNTNTKPLPPACTSTKEMERRKANMHGGVVGTWYRESNLLTGVGGKNNNNNNNAASGGDPWKNVGSGMRLDGKAAVANAPPGDSWQDAAGTMTEEEQLQFAMAVSLESPPLHKKPRGEEGPSDAVSNKVEQVQVPPEPALGTAGSVRIQFRLPSKPRLVRRFMETDLVAVLVQFCQDEEGGTTLDLRYGFPPKDLKPFANQTIGESKLDGESIQGRCI
jgi:Ataxin-3